MRSATRTTNPYRTRPGQIARTLALQRAIEPLLRRGADHDIDTTAPLDQVVAAALRIAGEPAMT